jgi:hypothetical protein
VEESEQEDDPEAQIQDPDIDTIFRTSEETIEEETIEFERVEEEESVDPLNTSFQQLLAEIRTYFGPVSPQAQEEEDYVLPETPYQEEDHIEQEEHTETTANPGTLFGEELLGYFTPDTEDEPRPSTEPRPARSRLPFRGFFRRFTSPRARHRDRGTRTLTPRRLDLGPPLDPTDTTTAPPRTRVPSAVPPTQIANRINANLPYIPSISTWN